MFFFVCVCQCVVCGCVCVYSLSVSVTTLSPYQSHTRFTAATHIVNHSRSPGSMCDVALTSKQQWLTEEIKASPLANKDGFVEVDKTTLQVPSSLCLPPRGGGALSSSAPSHPLPQFSHSSSPSVRRSILSLSCFSVPLCLFPTVSKASSPTIWSPSSISCFLLSSWLNGIDHVHALTFVSSLSMASLHSSHLPLPNTPHQHVRFPNVFGCGDSSSLPTSKTAAALSSQVHSSVVIRIDISFSLCPFLFPLPSSFLFASSRLPGSCHLWWASAAPLLQTTVCAC